jgi:RecA-family ATPase
MDNDDRIASPPREQPKPFDDHYMLRDGWHLAHRHPYPNADGVPQFEKLRYERPDPDEPKGYKKKLFFRHANGDGRLFWGMGNSERPLYRLQNLVIAEPGESVFICESEKVCDKLAKLNLLATCVASSWENVDLGPLHGRPCVVLVDNDVDGTGEKKARATIEAVTPIAASIQVVRGGPPGGNLADRLDDEISVEEFIESCRSVPFYKPEDEQQEPPPEPLVYVDISKWIDAPVPRREWVVLNRIPAKNVTILSGTGGTGKSIIALQLTAAVVLGRDWFGTMPQQGPVIYLSAEDDEEELHRRVADICKHLSVSYQDLIKGGLHLIDKAGKNAMLAIPDRGVMKRTPLLDQLDAVAQRLRPKLVIFDNRNKVFGGNMNDAVHVGDFLTGLHGFCRAAETSVLLIAHPSVAGMGAESSHRGLAGVMAWHDLPRGRMYFETVKTDDDSEPDKDLRRLVCQKNNYGPDDEIITLRWKTGIHGSGAFVMEAAPGSLEQLATDKKADELFLALIGKLTRQGRIVSHKKNANNYAPNVFANEADAKAANIRRPMLERAMARLFEANKIIAQTYGPPSRQSSKLVTAMQETPDAGSMKHEACTPPRSPIRSREARRRRAVQA